jgi:hypothetical protein
MLRKYSMASLTGMVYMILYIYEYPAINLHFALHLLKCVFAELVSYVVLVLKGFMEKVRIEPQIRLQEVG